MREKRFNFDERPHKRGGVKDYPDEWVCKTCAWAKGSKKTLCAVKRGQKKVWCVAAEIWTWHNSDRMCYEEPLEMLEKRKAYNAKLRSKPNDL